MIYDSCKCVKCICVNCLWIYKSKLQVFDKNITFDFTNRKQYVICKNVSQSIFNGIESIIYILDIQYIVMNICICITILFLLLNFISIIQE